MVLRRDDPDRSTVTAARAAAHPHMFGRPGAVAPEPPSGATLGGLAVPLRTVGIAVPGIHRARRHDGGRRTGVARVVGPLAMAPVGGAVAAQHDPRTTR